METPLAQVLAQHGQFVRALALHLLRDPSLADDAEQDTWLRYLERAPAERGQLRGWLRRVLNNWSVSRQRGARAVAALDEREPARGELSPVEHAERAELLTRLVAAVVALDEPYQGTILERYFRGRDAHTLAQETGTPLATVRSREQRALDKLRLALDRDFGGRSSWALGLARLALDGSAPLAAPSGWAPRLAVALAAGVLGAGLLYLREAERGPAAERVGPLAAVAPEAVVPAPPSTPPSARREDVHALAVGESSAVAPAPAPASPAEIRGRLVFPGGAPAAGLAVTLTGRPGMDLVNGAGNVLPAEDADWKDAQATSAPDGRFAFAFVPPPVYAFELAAKPAGSARALRMVYDLAPGAVVELGDIELVAGGAVEGHVRDTYGALVVGPAIQDMLVQVIAEQVSPGLERDERAVLVRESSLIGADGAYRIEDLPPGRVRLLANNGCGGVKGFDGPEVVIVAGETVVQDLVYRGPDLARRITLTTHARGGMPFRPAPDTVRLSAPGLAPRAAFHEPSRLPFVFDDLAPGEYTLTLDDPLFLPWRQTGVSPGTDVSAEVVGSSALVLDVRDGEGSPLAYDLVEVDIRNVNFMPTHFRLFAGDTPPADGRIDGLVAGDYTLTVSVAGRGSRSTPVERLLAGETRALALVFGPEASLAGRLRRADGAPVANTTVLLLEPARIDDSPQSRVAARNTSVTPPERVRHELARTRSDADGRFRFELSAPGTYAVFAAQGALDAASEALSVAAGQQRDGLELVLPVGGRIEGRVRLAEAACAGLRVWARDASSVRGTSVPGRERTELAADGSFALGPFAAGTTRLALLLPAKTQSPWQRSLGERIEGGRPLGVVEVREGEVTRVDFALDELPGAVSVAALVGGAPAVGVKVGLVEPLGEGDLEHACGASDGTGHALLPAFPGAYHVLVEDAGAGWCFVDPAPLEVAAGEMREALASVELVAGELTLVDAATRAPLAHERLGLLVAFGGGWHLSGCHPQTDANGRVALRLPAGVYRFLRAGRPVATTLSWTAQGALEPRMEL